MDKPNLPPSLKATTDSDEGLQVLLTQCRIGVERALDRWLPPADTPPRRLHEAMRYASLAGGKYIRPVLVYATGQALDIEPTKLHGPACAVELIHAYSLVHDDLPAMDNDLLRRGKPSCHAAFGEATAILAGDALQALAFHILAADSSLGVSASVRLRMVDTLAIASSSLGMAGGQAVDLDSVGKHLTLEELENMHHRKTGALIQAAVMLGALSFEGLDETVLNALTAYARCIGLAFQIRDDILDVEGDTKTLGKAQGADSDRDKPTYPALLGLSGAKKKATEMHAQALYHLAGLGPPAAPLRWLSEYIVQRRH
jgi:geranylgeranyl pyrophosphate synthase